MFLWKGHLNSQKAKKHGKKELKFTIKQKQVTGMFPVENSDM